MAYRKPPTYVRNDALTPGNWNQLATNATELQRVLRHEHIEGTGEHNTPLIARTLGTVLLSAGPTYSLVGFNADASLETGHNPSTGKIILTLASDRYEANSGPIMVQNAASAGDSAPCLSWARWFDDTRVEIYSSIWTGTLGSAVDGAWETGGDDATFYCGVHSKKLQNTSPNDFGQLLLGRQGLRAGARNVYANQLIQGSANLEKVMRAAHTAGVHDTREIPKLWAHVQWNGSTFDIVDQEASDTCDAGELDTVDIDSTGVLNVVFDGAFASDDYQVFVDVDYSRLAGSIDDYFIAVPPHDQRQTDHFYLYLYEKSLDGSGVEIWDRGHEVDFHLWIFDDH